MARDSAKSVQRAASTGGGRTYRGSVPVNWYAGLILIVILGLASIVFARHEYQRPAAATLTSQPAVGTTWYAGMSFYICGKQEASVPASTNTATVGLTTSGNGVVVLAPKTASEAGKHATLGRFVAGYRGMTVTSTKLGYPGQPVLTSGESCPAGTPDAGKKGVVAVKYWPNATVSTEKGALVADPPALRLGNNSLVTMAFVPSGTTVPRPPPSVELAVLRAPSQAATTTTLPTTATVPSTGSTTLPTTATTAPSATPTTAPRATVTPTTARPGGTSATTAAK